MRRAGRPDCWSTGGCHRSDAGSVWTQAQHEAADRDTVQDENHLEACYSTTWTFCYLSVTG